MATYLNVNPYVSQEDVDYLNNVFFQDMTDDSEYMGVILPEEKQAILRERLALFEHFETRGLLDRVKNGFNDEDAVSILKDSLYKQAVEADVIFLRPGYDSPSDILYDMDQEYYKKYLSKGMNPNDIAFNRRLGNGASPRFSDYEQVLINAYTDLTYKKNLETAGLAGWKSDTYNNLDDEENRVLADLELVKAEDDMNKFYKSVRRLQTINFPFSAENSDLLNDEMYNQYVEDNDLLDEYKDKNNIEYSVTAGDFVKPNYQGKIAFDKQIEGGELSKDTGIEKGVNTVFENTITRDATSELTNEEGKTPIPDYEFNDNSSEQHNRNYPPI